MITQLEVRVNIFLNKKQCHLRINKSACTPDIFIFKIDSLFKELGSNKLEWNFKLCTNRTQIKVSIFTRIVKPAVETNIGIFLMLGFAVNLMKIKIFYAFIRSEFVITTINPLPLPRTKTKNSGNGVVYKSMTLNVLRGI